MSSACLISPNVEAVICLQIPQVSDISLLTSPPRTQPPYFEAVIIPEIEEAKGPPPHSQHQSFDLPGEECAGKDPPVSALEYVLTGRRNGRTRTTWAPKGGENGSETPSEEAS
jgi:hypothetical protein